MALRFDNHGGSSKRSMVSEKTLETLMLFCKLFVVVCKELQEGLKVKGENLFFTNAQLILFYLVRVMVSILIYFRWPSGLVHLIKIHLQSIEMP